jgi:hypothetical protein
MFESVDEAAIFSKVACLDSSEIGASYLQKTDNNLGRDEVDYRLSVRRSVRSTSKEPSWRLKRTRKYRNIVSPNWGWQGLPFRMCDELRVATRRYFRELAGYSEAVREARNVRLNREVSVEHDELHGAIWDWK